MSLIIVFNPLFSSCLKHIDFDCQKIASKRNQKASMSYLSQNLFSSCNAFLQITGPSQPAIRPPKRKKCGKRTPINISPLKTKLYPFILLSGVERGTGIKVERLSLQLESNELTITVPPLKQGYHHGVLVSQYFLVISHVTFFSLSYAHYLLDRMKLNRAVSILTYFVRWHGPVSPQCCYLILADQYWLCFSILTELSRAWSLHV